MTIWPVPDELRSNGLKSALFPPGVSLKKIAIPVEHGGWGILFEPVLLAMIAFPSFAGLFVSLAAVSAFFARQPLKLALIDRGRGRVYPRTRAAAALTILFGTGAAVFYLLALASGGLPLALPLLLAAPLALVQLRYDARNDSRQLLPELAGAGAMGGVAAMIALGAGAPALVAAVLWAIVLFRSIPTILYVRSRVLIERGSEGGRAIPLLAHIAAFAGALALFGSGLAPIAVPVVFGLLLTRCAVGLSPLRRPSSAKAVGFTEIGWGAVAALAIGIALAAAGYS